ncbi:ParM/StbA family protein [Sulfobacillus harzensis]|uniref:ParM/StbA family protein n=1 Tax=Sulfobacillus harzensis TaxID=2729629 RepID=A0A7Y0L8E3_9FIRM|nr:ParM/StbA family protein [Sulfobacillus harzensis]NMP24360.1 ParM/StbA family protein [Sulfobacillus harzensis]
MPIKVAIDAGHGYTKALVESGERVLFPSLIAQAPQGVDLGEFGQSDTVRIDGQPFLVGESARLHAPPLWSRDKAADPDTLRLILVAAAQLGAVGPVALATGLPLSWFGSQRRAFREALMGYGGVVELAEDRLAQRVWFESVVVLPQGVAGAVVVLADPAYRPGPYVVVDVGYRTTEYLVVTKQADGKLAYDATQAGSLEAGTHAVGAAVAKALEHDCHLSFTPAEVEDGETVFVQGRAVALAGYREQAQRVVARQIRDQLTEVLDDRLLKAAGIVLVGGGSALLATAFPGAVVLSDGQWANAKAYLSA